MSTKYLEPGHPDSDERCPVCVSHGVLSASRTVEVSPGVYERRDGQKPCPRCVRLGFISADYGVI